MEILLDKLFLILLLKVKISRKYIVQKDLWKYDNVYLLQPYVIKLLVIYEMLMVSSVYSDFLHQWNWSPRYNRNNVESGVKHP